MKKILITGGAGFIGSALCKLLLKNNFEITVLDNLSPQIHGSDPERGSPLYLSINKQVNFIRGDVTVKDDLQRAISDNDTIVHLAAETGTGQSMYKIGHYVYVNEYGTALMLDILSNTKNNVEKVVVASSRSIYGEGRYFSQELDSYVYPLHRSALDMDRGDFEVKYPGCYHPLKLVATDEEAKVHPSSVYGITKQNQEQLVMTVCPPLGIAPVALRYQNVYGPGQSLANPYTGILSIFSNLIRRGREINVFEDGKESRDFVYIDDVVMATYKAIVNERANGEVYNVGTGTPTNVITVAETLVKAYNKEVPINITGNYRIGDIRHNYADLSKIKADLNYDPQYTFSQGIARFAEWVVDQEVIYTGYEESITEMKNKGLLK